jgi:hypothetical protein
MFHLFHPMFQLTVRPLLPCRCLPRHDALRAAGTAYSIAAYRW